MDQSQVVTRLRLGPFQFEPTLVSLMGGVLERQIRSVRNVLASLSQSRGQQLVEESLRTFMSETEAIVNSRPLTTDGLCTSGASQPTTPNHLLT